MVLALLEDLDIRLVNLTAGSASTILTSNDRPFIHPLMVTNHPRILWLALHDRWRWRENSNPGCRLIIVGTGYSYLQDFLPHVAQGALREGWVDIIGLGRMILSYPQLLLDASEGRTFQHRLVCRTFSDCTTAPPKGLPSGCYPLTALKRSELPKN